VIVGAIDPQRCGLGHPALVQMQTEPGSTWRVAQTVATRADVRYLTIVSGRTDIVCELIVRDRTHLAAILLHEMAAIDGILSTQTAPVLRTYKSRDEWSRVFLPAQALDETSNSPGDASLSPPKMDDLDMSMIMALGQDGRRSHVELASDLGISETAVARRFKMLLAGRQLAIATLVDPLTLGFEIETLLFLRVDLSTTETVANFLASRPEIRYVAATAGHSGITCEAVFKDDGALYDFVMSVLGSLKGVRDLEIAVELQTVKRAFRHLDFGRSAGSGAPAAEQPTEI
jgi:DNA-binding Lrp family transcriptional regulator